MVENKTNLKGIFMKTHKKMKILRKKKSGVEMRKIEGNIWKQMMDGLHPTQLRGGWGTRPYPWPQTWAENHFFRFSNAPTNPRNGASSIRLVSQISKTSDCNTQATNKNRTK